MNGISKKFYISWLVAYLFVIFICLPIILLYSSSSSTGEFTLIISEIFISSIPEILVSVIFGSITFKYLLMVLGHHPNRNSVVFISYSVTVFICSGIANFGMAIYCQEFIPSYIIGRFIASFVVGALASRFYVYLTRKL